MISMAYSEDEENVPEDGLPVDAGDDDEDGNDLEKFGDENETLRGYGE